jgi:alpha/beta superfamily hydrolase
MSRVTTCAKFILQSFCFDYASFLVRSRDTLATSIRYSASLLFVVLSPACPAQTTPVTADVELAVCGSFIEPLFFSILSNRAESQVLPIPDWPHLDRLTVPVRDGTEIKGFRLKSRLPDSKPIASLLVVQGNAMLAQNLLRELNSFSQIGLDVYVFDFRGYGLSGGKPRFKAIVDDYKELRTYISSQGSNRQLQYGMSFGGVVLLSANKASDPPSRLVIDSSPSIVSNQGCPTSYDPINNLPANANNVAIIAGGKDETVASNASRALVELVRSRGGTVIEKENWVHPFMERTAGALNERLAAVQELLLRVLSEEKK